MKGKLKIMEEEMRISNIYLIVIPAGENREVAFEGIMVENFLHRKKNESLK